MLLAFAQRIAVDQDVVDVGCAENIEEWSEDVVDKVPKCARSVRKARRKNQILEKTVSCAKRRLQSVTLCNAQTVEGSNDVELAVVISLTQAIQGHLNQ